MRRTGSMRPILAEAGWNRGRLAGPVPIGRVLIGLVLIGLLVIGSGGGAAAQPAAADPEVEAAQQMLRTLGYDPGPADGRMGGRTRRALQAFQGANGLPVTGEIDAATRTRLLAPPPGVRVVRAPQPGAGGGPPAVPVAGVEAQPLPGSADAPGTAPAAQDGGAASGGSGISAYAGLVLLFVAVAVAGFGLWWLNRHWQPEAAPDDVLVRIPPTFDRPEPVMRAPARTASSAAATVLAPARREPGFGGPAAGEAGRAAARPGRDAGLRDTGFGDAGLGRNRRHEPR